MKSRAADAFKPREPLQILELDLEESKGTLKCLCESNKVEGTVDSQTDKGWSTPQFTAFVSSLFFINT